MTALTKTETKILPDGRQVRVVVGWNYTLHHFWFVVYVMEPGEREVQIPAPDSLAAGEQDAFRRGFEIGTAADGRLLKRA